MRDFFGIMVLVLAGLVSYPVLYISFWLTVVVFLALVALFLYNAIQMVPASPPHKAVLTFMGKRQEVVLDEGWNYVPLYPWIFGFVLVKVEKVNDNFAPQEVMTPDNAKLSVTQSMTWIPGVEGEPGSFITFLNSGGEKGVREIVHDMVEDRTKTWARSNKEGPSSWEEAQGLKDDVHGVLTKSLLGDALDPIDDPDPNSPVPTSTWMRFFDSPQSEPTKYDSDPRNGWASKRTDAMGNVIWDWNGLQAKFNAYSPEAQALLRHQVAERRKRIREIREGRGKFPNRSLGITILRFTVNGVKVEGPVAEAAQKAETERKERDAEKVQMDNVSDRAVELMRKHPGLTAESALKIVLLEQGKISGQTYDFGLAGVLSEIVKRFPSPSANPPPNP